MLRISPDFKTFKPYYKDHSIFLTDNLEDFDLPESVFIKTEEDYQILRVPAKIILCENCGGKGKHLRTSMRDIAYTSEDFDDDPDFYEDMMEGRYDQMCEDCNGDGRYYDINEIECNKEVLKAINNHFQIIAEIRAEEAYERRMGY